jgi:ATP-dependent DNA helicase RecQ
MSDSIQRLREALKGEIQETPAELPSTPSLDYAVNRLRLAIGCDGEKLTSDAITLLRQVVRWSGRSSIVIERPNWWDDAVKAQFSKAGLSWTASGDLSAKPYKPLWLENGYHTIDLPPTNQGPQPSEKFRAEAYLKRNLNFEQWMSPAQKEATWTVLNAPSGSTRIIVLPTGCGKSTGFWILPTFTTGLTVVVVPTVALAIDQYLGAKERYKNLQGSSNPNPIFFSSDENPETTVALLQEKKSRIVFASPETCVSGKLRGILEKFAEEGWFQNLVVDEAHLIETWGAQFRIEFQLLGAMRKKWSEKNPKLRTFLFSATMSKRCRSTLSSLFGNEREVEEFVCQRLRPEMSYFAREFLNDKERWPKLVEALRNLPRPAILYLTKPDHAVAMHARLVEEENFTRCGCFSGETNASDRKEILKKWKDNQLDLMVATSAFGVGMDKSDVRTIIHACYPENLDRYYQEVGRSGRDGYSSICLFLPTPEDRHTGEGLGVTLLGPEKIQERWEAMYRQSPKEDGYILKIPLHAKGSSLIGELTFTQHVNWNKRLLMMLQRAGKIDFKDLIIEKDVSEDESFVEWAKVKLLDFSPGTKSLGEEIIQQRNQEKKYFKEGFKEMANLLKPNRCISRYLKRLYSVSKSQTTCGGCSHCRSTQKMSSPCPTLKTPVPKEDHESQRGVIVESFPSPLNEKSKDLFIDRMEQTLGKHNLKPFHLICDVNHCEIILNLLEKEELFNTYNHPYRIDYFSKNHQPNISSEQMILYFHIEKFSEEMLEHGKGFRAVHFFSDISEIHQANGRHVKIEYSCESLPNPEAWLYTVN